MTNHDMPYPEAAEREAAGDIFMRVAQSYGYTGTIHDAINLLARAARTLSPKVAKSAMDSSCSDIRPELTGTGRATDAWDLTALAHALNGTSR